MRAAGDRVAFRVDGTPCGSLGRNDFLEALDAIRQASRDLAQELERHVPEHSARGALARRFAGVD